MLKQRYLMGNINLLKCEINVAPLSIAHISNTGLQFILDHIYAFYK